MRMETRVDALRAVGTAGPAPEPETGPDDLPPGGEPSAAADGPAGAMADAAEGFLPDAPADTDAVDMGAAAPDVADADPADTDPPEDPSAGADLSAEEAGAEDPGMEEPEADDALADDPVAAEAGAAAPLVLPARVTQPMAESFLAAAREGGALPVIDARGVEHLSTAYALVLVSLARARAAEGRRLAILAPSAAFVDAFADLGLFQDLMKMEFCQ